MASLALGDGTDEVAGGAPGDAGKGSLPTLNPVAKAGGTCEKVCMATSGPNPRVADIAGLDLAALLLDGRNAPLRRIAMDANPAKTISSMPPEMQHQLKQVCKWA